VQVAQESAPNAASEQQKPAPAAPAIPTFDKPGGMGLPRIVEIDTTGGPGFGFEHFKQYDFLRQGSRLHLRRRALPRQHICRAQGAGRRMSEGDLLRDRQARDLAPGDHQAGTHTWSRKDLAPNPYAKDIEQAKAEIEMGISAVNMAQAAERSRRSSASRPCSIRRS
jgi:hypothetical protein